MTNHTLLLADGRELGYACYGPEAGRPVLYFHGTPSSRLEPAVLNIYGKPIESLLQQHHLKLIAVDRPGIGLSTYHKARSFDSFANDVQALVTALQLPPCPLFCWSGGGPYALAFAYRYPHLVTTLFIVAGFSRSFNETEVYQKLGWNKLYFSAARKMSLVLESVLFLLKFINVRTPISQQLYDLAHPDYALLKKVTALNPFLQYTVKEAVRKSAKGAVQEAALYYEPFPYSLKAIHTPVHFWWGTEDTMVPYIHARSLETLLPAVTPHYKKGEGHISIFVSCIEEILQTMAQSIDHTLK